MTATTELGQTKDPKALIPGSPEAVTHAAETLVAQGGKLQTIGQDLGTVRIDGWLGPASTAFWDGFTPEKPKWLTGQAALQSAAEALHGHAETLRWAQSTAADAIDLWERGEAATKAAKTQFDQDLVSAKESGATTPSFSDPGEELRQQARELLQRARTQLAEAGGTTASAITGHGGGAPNSPTWLASAAKVVKTATEDYGVGKFTVAQDLKEFGDKELIPDAGKKKFGHQNETAGEEGNSKKPKVNVKLGELKGEANLFDLTAKGKTKLGDVALSGSAGVKAGVEGSVGASVGSDGLKAEAKASAGVTASAEGRATYGITEVGGSAKGFAGAEAGAETSVGKDGVHAGASAFAGAKAEGEAHADVGGVGAGVKGEAWAGAGAEANVDFGMKDGKFTVGGEAGVGLGVGGELGTEVTVDSGKVAHTVTDAAGSVGHVAGDAAGAAKKVGSALNPFD
jgi:hypothetical protein